MSQNFHTKGQNPLMPPELHTDRQGSKVFSIRPVKNKPFVLGKVTEKNAYIPQPHANNSGIRKR